MLSSIAADHVNVPRNLGPLPSATHLGQIGVPGEGPHVTLWFRIEDDIIKQAAWASNGCPTAMACASMTAQVLTGRTVEQAMLLTSTDLDILLQGLPDGKGDCATRAIAAVHSALSGASRGGGN